MSPRPKLAEKPNGCGNNRSEVGLSDDINGELFDEI